MLIKISKVVLTFILLTLVFYLLLTAPSWWSKLAFKIKGTTAENKNLAKPILISSGFPNPIYAFPDNLSDNDLFIPKINVLAPVTWNVKESQILTDLNKGLVHFKDTALPGENGNVFIAGHSSNYWWTKSNFNRVFAILPELKIGDAIYLKYLGKKFIYQVTEIQTVSPKDVSVIAPTKNPILTLMTCVPVGTNQKRLIIKAKQISPVENSATQKKPKTQLQEIPKVL